MSKTSGNQIALTSTERLIRKVAPPSQLFDDMHRNLPINNQSVDENRCPYCRKLLTSATGVKRHIQQSERCRRAWDAWISSELQETSASTSSSNKEPPTAEPDDPMSPPGADSVVYTCSDTPMSTGSADSTSRRENPYQARVKEVPDEDDLMRWVQTYPRPAAQVLGMGECTFERWRRENEESGKPRWFPFASEKEWELGRWLIKNVGQNQIETFLKLPIVCYIPAIHSLHS